MQIIDGAQWRAKARMNKLDRRVPQCLDEDALSLLHTCPQSLEPSRAMVNIHMQSISAQGDIPLTISSAHLATPLDRNSHSWGRLFQLPGG